MEQELNTNKFATSHVSELRNFYEDEDSRRNRYDQGSAGYGYGRNANIPTPEEVVNMLANADKEKCRITSEKLYMSDPNYQKMINYLANIFLYR